MTAPAKIDIAASHQGRIGCSEIAAALGLSPWKTPYQLWLEKTGRAQPPDLGHELRIQIGNDLEAYVAELYCRMTGHSVRRDRTRYVFEDPPLVGNIDRRVIGQRKGLECKTSLSKWGGADWTDEEDGIPMHYLCQVHGYLLVTGWDSWDVVSLLAGPNVVIKTIYPDAEFHRLFLEGLTEFWWHVQNDTPPNPATLEDASRRWAQHVEGQTVTADSDTLEILADLLTAKARVKAAELERDCLELALKSSIGTAEALLGPDGKTLCTWKSQTSTRVDTTALKAANLYETYTKTTISRVFRLKGEK